MNNINNIVNNIMEVMDKIEYGFLDENGLNIIDNNPKKWNENFYDFYYLLTPKELLEKKCGVCWDQVELERSLFQQNNINVKTYFICGYCGIDKPCHTFLVYEEKEKYYWFEHAWGRYKGIHEYKSREELLLDVKNKFIATNKISSVMNVIIYEYTKPRYNITCAEYYEFCEGQKIIKI